MPPQFLQARNYTPASRTAVDLVVLHSMENAERPGSAQGVAMWFASKDAPRASAHYCVDEGEAIQCVADKDVAWHAPGANHNGIGIEHAGRASQSAADWLDSYSTAMLWRSIDLCAAICRRWHIPAALIGVEGLQAGRRGITTHALVSLAFRKSSHTDPGTGFPIAWYVGRVQARLKESVNA